MPLFFVSPPNVTVQAVDVIEAARRAKIRCATVSRLDYDGPAEHLIKVVVDFGFTPATHFVGFRGEEYHSAVRLWGKPDFYHRVWDQRAQREIADCDTVIFAKYDPDKPSPFNYDDSNQEDDPAAAERLER